MQPLELDPQARAVTSERDRPGDPARELNDSYQRARELLGGSEETVAGMLEAEHALRRLRERFEHTEDLQAQGELAAEALTQVERQLELTRERRQALDSVEGKLWAKRNHLERFLIHTRGRAWWHARRRNV